MLDYFPSNNPKHEQAPFNEKLATQYTLKCAVPWVHWLRSVALLTYMLRGGDLHPACICVETLHVTSAFRNAAFRGLSGYE
jgi:hypothetical protein